MDTLREVKIKFFQIADNQYVHLIPGYLVNFGFYDFYTNVSPSRQSFDSGIPTPIYYQPDENGQKHPYSIGSFPSDASVIVIGSTPHGANDCRLEIYRDDELWAAIDSGVDTNIAVIYIATCSLYAPGFISGT